MGMAITIVALHVFSGAYFQLTSGRRAAAAQKRVDRAQANLPQPGSEAYSAGIQDGSLQKARAFHQKWFPPVQGYGDYSAEETRRTIRDPEFQRELAALPAKARNFAESLSISQLVRDGVSTDPERGTATAEGAVITLAFWALCFVNCRRIIRHYRHVGIRKDWRAFFVASLFALPGAMISAWSIDAWFNGL